MSVSSAPPLPLSPDAGHPAHAAHDARAPGVGGQGAGDRTQAKGRSGPMVRIAPSVLRMSLGGRLTIAGGCLALMWAVVIFVVGSGA